MNYVGYNEKFWFTEIRMTIFQQRKKHEIMILEFEMKKQNIRIKTSFAWVFSSLFSRFEYV